MALRVFLLALVLSLSGTGLPFGCGTGGTSGQGANVSGTIVIPGSVSSSASRLSAHPKSASVVGDVVAGSGYSITIIAVPSGEVVGTGTTDSSGAYSIDTILGEEGSQDLLIEAVNGERVIRQYLGATLGETIAAGVAGFETTLAVAALEESAGIEGWRNDNSTKLSGIDAVCFTKGGEALFKNADPAEGGYEDDVGLTVEGLKGFFLGSGKASTLGFSNWAAMGKGLFSGDLTSDLFSSISAGAASVTGRSTTQYSLARGGAVASLAALNTYFETLAEEGGTLCDRLEAGGEWAADFAHTILAATDLTSLSNLTKTADVILEVLDQKAAGEELDPVCLAGLLNSFEGNTTTLTSDLETHAEGFATACNNPDRFENRSDRFTFGGVIGNTWKEDLGESFMSDGALDDDKLDRFATYIGSEVTKGTRFTDYENLPAVFEVQYSGFTAGQQQTYDQCRGTARASQFEDCLDQNSFSNNTGGSTLISPTNGSVQIIVTRVGGTTVQAFACNTNTQCPPNQTCQGGLCSSAGGGGCVSNASCSAALVCSPTLGACAPNFCDSDLDCLAGQSCSQPTGSCLLDPVIIAGCTINADCGGSGQRCSAGLCVVGGCVSNADCTATPATPTCGETGFCVTPLYPKVLNWTHLGPSHTCSMGLPITLTQDSSITGNLNSNVAVFPGGGNTIDFSATTGVGLQGEETTRSNCVGAFGVAEFGPVICTNSTSNQTCVLHALP